MEIGLAIFGGVAAACTLSAELLRLGRSLRKMIKSIRYARHDISKTAEEMIIFAELFETFLDICSGSTASDAHVSFSPVPLISWARSATRGLRKLLKKVEALTPSPKDKYSFVETLTAHVRWYFSRSSVQRLRASLRVARESINGFANIRCIEKLEEQLRVLKRAVRHGERQALEEKLGMAVEKRMKTLEQHIKNRRQMRHEINKRLQSAKEDVIVHQEKSQNRDFAPETNELLDFTESVEQYVEEVLPSRGSSNGTRTSYQIHELEHEPVRASSKRSSPSTIATSIASKPEISNSEPPQQPAKATTMQEKLSNKLDIANEPPSGSSSSSSTPSASSTSTSDKALKPTLTSSKEYGNNTYRSTRAKEYINDPTGTILSPPKTKGRSLSAKPETVSGRWSSGKTGWQETGAKTTRDGLVEPFTAPEDALESTVEHDIRPPNVRVEGTRQIKEDEKDSENETGIETDKGDPSEGSSPFQPIAGVRGKFPPGWHQRHKRSESPQDFW